MANDKYNFNLENRAWQITKADSSVLDFDVVKKSIELIKATDIVDTSNFTSRAVNPSKIVRTAKRALFELMPGLNVQTKFISQKDMEKIVFENGFYQYTNEELLNALNKSFKLIDIFDVPFFYEESKDREAYSNFGNIFRDNNRYLNNMPLVISFIEAYGPADYLMVIMYEHELIHGLTRRFRGIIEDLYHEEALPITIEKIMSFEADNTEVLFSKRETQRNSNHQYSIEIIESGVEDLRGEAPSHLISGLIANCIFNRYYHESITGRKYILNELQTVLNGEKSFEQFLQEQSISLQNSEVLESTEFSLSRTLTKKDN